MINWLYLVPIKLFQMDFNIDSKVKLSNGVEMPCLGLGVFKAKDGEEVEAAIKYAFEAGYRSIDTATIYANEIGVGNAVKNSNIPRSDIFITTKVWNNQQGYKLTHEAFETSLEKLGLDYVDLYLIHWPNNQKTWETWKAMEELYDKGKIKAIGVSNFLIHHIEHLLKNSKIRPMVNQFEFHPELVQPELLKYCFENGIQPEAWSPLMQGKVNEISLIKDLADKYGKSPVQIVLRWNIQKGLVTIPKSSNRERIIQNADIFDFELKPEDMTKIDRLDKFKRIGADPDNYDF